MSARRTLQPSVGAVIVNWNTRDHLDRALRSFLDDGLPARNIVVVDQGSSDGSVAHAKKRFRGVKVVSIPENRSYAAAVNAGAARLKTEYLVVANADVMFEKGTIGALTDTLIRTPAAALAGPRLLNSDGDDVTRFSRTSVLRAVFLLLLPQSVRGWWRHTEQRLQKDAASFPVKFVEGCFAVLRRSAFDEVGGFDEAYSFYFEDADICLRLRKLGYTLVHCPTVTVTHVGGGSFSQVPDRYVADFYNGCLLFYRKHVYRKFVWLKRFLRVVVGTRLLLVRMGIGRRGEQGLRSLSKVVAGAGHRPPQGGHALPPTPMVSVIIPTYERVDCLLRLLDGLNAQSYKNFEVIVVDQSKSLDAGKERAYRRFGKNLRLVRSRRANRSFAKNLGAQHARGDVLLFCDDDIEAPPDLLITHVSAYADSTVGAVSCRVLEAHLASLRSQRIQRITFYGQMIPGFHSDVTCFVGTLAGQNMSVRSNIWRATSGFDVALTGTSIFEEPDFSVQVRHLGYSILFTNATAINHYPQPEGNEAQKTRDASAYYHSFHHNEILYFLKNRTRVTLLAVIPFCALRTVKQSLKFNMGPHDTLVVLKGIVDGFKTYYRLFN